MTIDGYTQAGAHPNTKAEGNDAALKIVLNGTNVSGPGFEIPGFSSNDLIKGLVINRFTGAAGIHGTSVGNRVEGNFIGTTAGGKGDLGNGLAGVAISGSNDSSSNNVLGDSFSGGSNTIAFNGRDGVNISGGLRNVIDGNSIFSNSGLGLDLADDGPTANDSGYGDSGPNDLQNKPVLSSAKTIPGKTIVKGKLESQPDSGYTIQFFFNPSGTNEGKKCIGQKPIVNTDASGNASFTFTPATTVPVGQTITATARAINLDAFHGDTSEFSAPRKVTHGVFRRIIGSGLIRAPTLLSCLSCPDAPATGIGVKEIR